MAHHHIGDVGDGKLGSWGFAEGGMGGVSNAMAAPPAPSGPRSAPRPRSGASPRDGRATGVVLEGGEELTADLVVAATHPRITFLEQVDRAELPADFVTDIERWKTRSGTVKVNLATDRLPRFTCRPEFDPEIHGGTIVLAESLDDMEGAFQDAAAGRPSAVPFADVCIPSVFDKTLAPEGHHIVSMFTQWVPHTWAGKPMDEELEAHADRVIARMERVAPGFTDSILFRQVIGPYQMEHEYGLVGGNIFHGELSASQLFHTRPAAGYADYRTPIRGLYQAGSATTAAAGSPASPAATWSARSPRTSAGASVGASCGCRPAGIAPGEEVTAVAGLKGPARLVLPERRRLRPGTGAAAVPRVVLRRPGRPGRAAGVAPGGGGGRRERPAGPDQGGELRAHYNVCRHRGSQVVPCPPAPPGGPRPARPARPVAALPLPLLDLPAGGRPAARPLERGDRRLRPGGLRAPPGRGGDLGRVRVPAPDPGRGGAPGRPARPGARAAAPLPAGGPRRRAAAHLPGGGQLEAGRRELQRVLPLRRGPPRAVPGRAGVQARRAGLDWEGIPHREGAWTFTATGQSDRAPFPAWTTTSAPATRASWSTPT